MSARITNREWCCCEGAASELVKDCGHTQSIDFVLVACSGCGKRWMSLYSVFSSSVGYVSLNDNEVARLMQMPEGRQGRRLLEELFDL